MDVSEFERRYDFALDEFQLEAIGHLSRDRSVLVAAPTGSGKTVIAEYALEWARSRGKKFFYTAPLKALSNQKFRDLSAVYPPQDVGLLTGDNSINGDAPVVVMTTEVLRNMLYEESEALDSLGVVVLDEVHYMHDPQRGPVWEEIVILLPRSVKLVGLSATVSNAPELADWMDSLRGDVEVVISRERPVKLKNYYFVGTELTSLFANDLPRIIGDQVDMLKKARSAQTPARRAGGRRARPLDLRPVRSDVIEELSSREMLPSIYFLFSRAACRDSVERWLDEGRSLVNEEESERILDFVDEKVKVIDRDDLYCLGYPRFRKALSWGVAAHHAGVLPLFKEAVEELFARGLIKVVFATETLSLGINMPARTVVIESLSKWNGEKHRPLTPGEYKQLTGRAGRRGIDEIGYAVVLHQRFFNPDNIRSLVSREPNPVVSSFQVTYNMAVNLLADHSIEESVKLLNLSFAQFVADRRVVTLETRLSSLEAQLLKEHESARCTEADAASYRAFERTLSRQTRELAKLRKERTHREIREAMRRLQPGDVFVMGHHEAANSVAVVRRPKGPKGEDVVTVVDSTGRYRRVTERSLSRPPHIAGKVDIAKVTSPTRKVRRSVGVALESIGRKSPGQGTKKMTDPEEALFESVAQLKEELEGNPCRKCRHRERCVEAARKAERVQQQMRTARKERDSGHDVVSRRLVDVIEVLKGYGFLQADVPTARGEMLRRVYNELDLLIVEALGQGLLNELGPEDLVAVASWFIYESREDDTEREREAREAQEYMEGGLRDTLHALEALEGEMKRAEASMGLDLLGSIDTGFSEQAFTWATGAPLEEMLEKFPERSVGDMVRTMKQIIDLLRQIAEVSPDNVLRSRLTIAMDLVDRGVVSYSSLESIIEHGADPGPAGARSEG